MSVTRADRPFLPGSPVLRERDQWDPGSLWPVISPATPGLCTHAHGAVSTPSGANVRASRHGPRPRAPAWTPVAAGALRNRIRPLVSSSCFSILRLDSYLSEPRHFEDGFRSDISQLGDSREMGSNIRPRLRVRTGSLARRHWLLQSYRKLHTKWFLLLYRREHLLQRALRNSK